MEACNPGLLSSRRNANASTSTSSELHSGDLYFPYFGYVHRSDTPEGNESIFKEEYKPRLIDLTLFYSIVSPLIKS